MPIPVVVYFCRRINTTLIPLDFDFFLLKLYITTEFCLDRLGRSITIQEIFEI